MRFQEGAEYREAATKTHPARIARGRTLEAYLDPASGALEEARFTEKFEFTENTLRASSFSGVYKIDQGTLALAGKEPPPHVENESLTIDANAIDITLEPMKVVANGRVRTTMLPAKKPAGGTAAPNRPGLLADQEAVGIVAEKLTYDESTRKAEYSGQARLLQGDTNINAEALTIDETKGDLTATGKVVTILSITEKDTAANHQAEADGRPCGRVCLFGSDPDRHLHDHRAARWRSRQPSGGEDRDEAGQGREHARRSRGGRPGHRARRQAHGHRHASVVRAHRRQVRRRGAPVKMIDADCQESSGKTLTFWKASDRVIIDGNDEVRTQSKGGGKCPQ